MSGGDVAATARVEIRAPANVMASLERAADLLKVPVSDFVRIAALDRADHVLHEHDVQTPVPAAFFEGLLDALDGSARPNEALARAAKNSLPRNLDFRS